MKKNGILSNSLIWLGAGLSIAEILTGTYFAPLGFKKGLVAIILGHLVGAVLMFFAGYIGADSKKNAMQTTSISFGNGGAKFFSSLNIVQLIGWTSIMIYDGALAANRLFPLPLGRGVWSLVIGALVILWLIISKNELNVVNAIAVSSLAFLCIFICAKIFSGNSLHSAVNDTQGTLSFIEAFELSVAMPLSWLPLISDYTNDSQRPFAVTLSSVIVYSVVSIMMYIVGMSMSIFTSQGDLAEIISHFGGIVSIIGLYIIVFSTVTTTYLDAYSIGISSMSITQKAKTKSISCIAVAFASICAFLFNMDNITNFLYLIGSVFSPMIAIQIADYFILKSRETRKGVYWKNLFVWLLGFEMYHYFLRNASPFSSTIPAMLVSFVATILIRSL